MARMLCQEGRVAGGQVPSLCSARYSEVCQCGAGLVRCSCIPGLPSLGIPYFYTTAPNILF